MIIRKGSWEEVSVGMYANRALCGVHPQCKHLSFIPLTYVPNTAEAKCYRFYTAADVKYTELITEPVSQKVGRFTAYDVLVHRCKQCVDHFGIEDCNDKEHN
jgi:hypothetical protein